MTDRKTPAGPRRRAGLILLLGALAASGCASQFDHMLRPPTITAPGDSQRPVPAIEAARIDLSTPPPPAEPARATPASLWRSGPTSLFGDRRARTRGDILTVVIELDEEAEIRNRTDRNKQGQEELSVPAFLGVPTWAAGVLPGGAGLDPAVEASSASSSSGDGLIRRQERLTLRVAATVTGVLPNGHLSIAGSQEIRVNYELRELLVAGIVRPEDISRDNAITYDKIADARIAYGGRGQLSDLQRARYGPQILDIISPF